MVIQKNKQPLILTMEYGNISVTQLKKIRNGYIFLRWLLEIYCDSVYINWINQIKLVFLFIINKNVNFECISIAKLIINLFNDKLIV